MSDIEATLTQTESIKTTLQESLKTVREELMEIEDKLTTSELKNTELNTQIIHLEEANSKTINQNKGFLSSDTEQKEKILKLETLQNHMRRENTELNAKFNAQRQELEKQNIELKAIAAEAFERQTEELQLKITMLESTAKDLQVEHERAMELANAALAQKVEKQTKELQHAFSLTQNELEKHQTDSKRELEVMQDKLDKDAKGHKVYLKRLQEEHDVQSEDQRNCVIQLEEKLNQSIKVYKKDLGESNARLVDLEVKYNDAKRDADGNAQRLEPMEEQVSKQLREIVRLKEASSVRSGLIGELEGNLDSSKQQLDHISAKYESQRREADRARNTLRESQAQVSELRSELSALKSQVQEIPVHEAEVDRLRRRIEEGSSKQNAAIRELQTRTHEAENRAQRAEEKIVEESTKLKMESSRAKHELVNKQREMEAIQSDMESRLREQEEQHSRQLEDAVEKNRRFKSELETVNRSMEQMRSDQHTQIMELQDRMTREAEQFLAHERQHTETESNSLKRAAEKIQREAEEMAHRQEQSWLTERSYMRKELDTARGAAQHAQKALQKVMLDMERQIIETDKIKGELRAEHQAHVDTNATLVEMRKMSFAVEDEKMKVQRLENELRASEKTTVHAEQLEHQLLDTEKALQEAVAQRLELETQLGNVVNTSRVDQLREKVGRLRDAVSSDTFSRDVDNVNNNKSTTQSQSAILDALSVDHSRALTANGELRRELAREQDAAGAANKRLYDEREAASTKIKQLTTILRQAQESWDRERENILDSKRKADLSKHEFENAAKLYSRLSKDATSERDNALRSLEDQSELLYKKRAELREARSNMLQLRDDNINLSHQTEMLRTEVSKITNVTARKRRIAHDLDSELETASKEIGGLRGGSISGISGISGIVGSNNGSFRRSSPRKNRYGGGFTKEKAGSNRFHGVREAEEEVAAMRNFFNVPSRRSRSLTEEADRIAWDVQKHVGEV